MRREAAVPDSHSALRAAHAVRIFWARAANTQSDACARGTDPPRSLCVPCGVIPCGAGFIVVAADLERAYWERGSRNHASDTPNDVV